jgi:hypothetical protein
MGVFAGFGQITGADGSTGTIFMVGKVNLLLPFVKRYSSHGNIHHGQ